MAATTSEKPAISAATALDVNSVAVGGPFPSVPDEPKQMSGLGAYVVSEDARSRRF
jgi:hypothetical protein